MSSSKSDKFKILALDGGGIRGVITAHGSTKTLKDGFVALSIPTKD